MKGQHTVDLPRYAMTSRAVYGQTFDKRTARPHEYEGRPQLCLLNSEDADNYYGSFVFGYGFINVQFPKTHVRDLTDAENKRYSGRQLFVGDEPYRKLPDDLRSWRRYTDFEETNQWTPT